jgi:2-oxoglutarate dehydrogenase E2 component (dihydrolipoamide succinyltransferase)
MQVEVKVPQLSESVSEATLVAWRKKAGEAVKRDENLIDVETDKVVLELPAPSDGVLVKIVKNDGDSVTSGEVIAVIDTDGKVTVASSQTAVTPAPDKGARGQAPSGGQWINAVPARRSCRNWRSRSTSAHRNPRPSARSPSVAMR